MISEKDGLSRFSEITPIPNDDESRESLWKNFSSFDISAATK